MYKGIIFDLDGTLLDTIDDLANAANTVLKSSGYPTHSVDAFKEMIGDGINILVQRMLPVDNWPEDKIKIMVHQMEKVYRNSWKNQTKPFVSVPKLLDELTQRKLQMAILSNKPEEFTIEMVKSLLRKWTFDPVLGATPERPKKPDPAAAIAIVDYWKYQPSECLFIGDSEPDIRTAKNAGIVSVAVSWGFRSRQRLIHESPDYIIDSPVDLLNLL